MEFRRADGTTAPLVVGVIEVHIRFAGQLGVRVVHADDHSITLATLRGHPEHPAGALGAHARGSR